MANPYSLLTAEFLKRQVFAERNSRDNIDSVSFIIEVFKELSEKLEYDTMKFGVNKDEVVFRFLVFYGYFEELNRQKLKLTKKGEALLNYLEGKEK